MSPHNYREVDIEAISEPDGFRAWGYSVLKVQRGPDIIGVRVKITSVPQDVIDELRKRAPRPPAKTVMLDPSSEDGRRLGVTTRQKAIIPDYSDSAYLEKQEEHDLMFRREIVGRGVDAKLTLSDGAVANTPEETYRALEQRGLSGLHFTELAENILRLTQWSEEERANFLTPNSESTPGR